MPGHDVGATLIAASSSTKNNEGKRDPEMHQTKKDNQWYFGMKVHIGVDKDLGLIHSVVVTSANVHNVIPAADLLKAMRRLSTATLATRSSPKGPRWKARMRNSELRCDQASAERCLIHQKENCRI